jgi:hypothetical protein
MRLNPARTAKAAIRSGEIVASETTCFMLNFNDLWLSADTMLSQRDAVGPVPRIPARIAKTRGFFEAGQVPFCLGHHAWAGSGNSMRGVIEHP